MLPDAQHRVWVKTKEAMQGEWEQPHSLCMAYETSAVLPAYYPIIINGVESNIWEGVRAYSAWMVSTMDRRRMRRDGPRTAKAADNATNSTISTSDAQGTYQGVPQLAVTVCS